MGKVVGCTKDDLNTKIHTLTDVLENPLEFLFVSGNIYNSTVTMDFLSDLDLSESNIFVDKVYRTKRIIDYILGVDGSIRFHPKVIRLDLGVATGKSIRIVTSSNTYSEIYMVSLNCDPM